MIRASTHFEVHIDDATRAPAGDTARTERVVTRWAIPRLLCFVATLGAGALLAWTAFAWPLVPVSTRAVALALAALVLAAVAALGAWREARLRAVHRRLLAAGRDHLADAVPARPRDALVALEHTARVHAEEMVSVRGRLALLRQEEDAIRRVLGQVAPSTFRYTRAGLDIAGVNAAQGRCGGDWYMVRHLDDAHVLVALGDVAGHDPASAYMASALSGALRVLDAKVLLANPALALGLLHQLLDELSAGTLSSSCVLAVINVRTWRLRYVNAGHPAPWLMHAHGGVESLAASGGPLGLGELAHHVTRELQLALTDRLILFTDGVIEQGDASGRAFGLRRLLDATRTSLARQPAPASRQLLADVMKSFRDFSRSSSLVDDVSILVCHVASENDAMAALFEDEMPTDVSLIRPADAGAFLRVRRPGG